MASPKYLIVYKGTNLVPRSLRKPVQEAIEKEFKDFDVELDFSGRKKHRDLLGTFTNDVPNLPVYGVSSRMDSNGSLDAGFSTIYVGLMLAMRLQTSEGNCQPAFTRDEKELGSMIANTAIHETAHMLGLDTGGHDDGGHVSDPDNYMWDPSTMPVGDTYVSRVLEYVVQRGDTLSGIVRKYRSGKLDQCRVGGSDTTYQQVWDLPPNKEKGFVAHPTKSGITQRRANDPDRIYPGEKVALFNHTLRKQTYRMYYVGLIGKKTFTDDQKNTMKKFIAERLKAGKG